MRSNGAGPNSDGGELGWDDGRGLVVGTLVIVIVIVPLSRGRTSRRRVTKSGLLLVKDLLTPDVHIEVMIERPPSRGADPGPDAHQSRR